MANLRSIGQAIDLYASDNQGSLPYGFVGQNETITNNPAYNANVTGYTFTDWTGLIVHEMNGRYSADGGQTPTPTSETITGVRSYFLCPSVAPGEETTAVGAYIVHYSCHPRMMCDLGTPDYLSFFAGVRPLARLQPYRLAHIKRSADMALIWDATLDNRGGSWDASADSDALDGGRLCRAHTTYLTDNYALDTVDVGISGNTPVDMTPNTGGTAPAPDGTASDFNADTTPNWGNIRFRHLGNTSANVLMVDGHVTSFTYNQKTMQTSLLRNNIGVNQ
jgi:prepilin-type processing-associated H-X9-DG protein